MNPITKLIAIAAASFVAVTGVFVAVALAVAPAMSVVSTPGKPGPNNLTVVSAETIDPPATDAEIAAFYAKRAPQVGDKSGDATITSVSTNGLGCYSYTYSYTGTSKPDAGVSSCVDVTTESFNAWVIDYRKTH
jgi:hypothetical protein